MNLDDIDVRALAGADLEAALDGVADLRITVFRDWPYLYDGSREYEREYKAQSVGRADGSETAFHGAAESAT